MTDQPEPDQEAMLLELIEQGLIERGPDVDGRPTFIVHESMLRPIPPDGPEDAS